MTLLTDIFSQSVETRRSIILHFIMSKRIRTYTHAFPFNGKEHYNIWISLNNQVDRSIIVSSHYDGPGAYDNAGGTVSLLYLIDLFTMYKAHHNFIFCFFDCEESGQVGSKAFLKTLSKKNIVQFLEIDGSGIGNCLVGVSNYTMLPVKISRKTIAIPCSGDFISFISQGIPAIHLFSLPVDEGKLFVEKHIYPDTFSILHTKKDNLKIVNDSVNKNVADCMLKIIKKIDKTQKYCVLRELLYFPF